MVERLSSLSSSQRVKTLSNTIWPSYYSIAQIRSGIPQKVEMLTHGIAGVLRLKYSDPEVIITVSQGFENNRVMFFATVHKERRSLLTEEDKGLIENIRDLQKIIEAITFEKAGGLRWMLITTTIPTKRGATVT